MPRVSIETLDPKKAELWKSTVSGNRPLNASTVNRYVQSMMAGDWEQNGDPIRFDKHGRLIDGQHRCEMVIITKQTIEVVVVRDLPETAFDTIDIGLRRRAADALSIIGFKNARDLAAAAVLVDAIRKGGVRSIARKTPREVQRIVEANPGLPAVVSKYGASQSERKALIPPSALAAMHYLFREVDSTLAEIFMDGLITGENLMAGEPVLVLRDRLIADAASKARITKAYKVALVIKAWNLTRAGKTVKCLRVRTDGDSPEAMPVIQ